MMKQGMWFTSSESDPRFDLAGEAVVGMFMGLESCHEAKAAIEDREQTLGVNRPHDLKFGYHKY